MNLKITKQKSEFSFAPLVLKSKKPICRAPVAVVVRKSLPLWVIFRFDRQIAERTQFRVGTVLTPFYDETKRAILFVSDVRPQPEGARRCFGKPTNVLVEFPRQGILKDWCPVHPIRPVNLVECSHGRLVITIPEVEV